MATRTVIEIDEEKCDGCGACANGCPEGAIRIIDGKARLVGDSLCDGLGACVGECPRGAIRTLEREAEAYDEREVMEGIVAKGPKTIAAHLDHLRHHGQTTWALQAEAFLRERGLPVPAASPREEPQSGKACEPSGGGCPGSRQVRFAPVGAPGAGSARSGSELGHWPIQLHLVNPASPWFAGADVLVAADCVAFSLGSFHSTLLAGKSLVIACPKLDSGREIYLDKLAALLSVARSVTVAIMEVPCCSGLLKLATDARARLSGPGPAIRAVTVGIKGELVSIQTW